MGADPVRAGGVGRFARAAAWYTVMLAIAVIAVGVQLDRQARYDPALGALVPEAFRWDALAALARSAFDRNNSREGEELARELVERRPVPAESLSLYATGLLANGKSDMAASILQVAADRGWRDRFVQHVVIASALQNDQPTVAAQRVVGLWRQGERAAWLKDLTRTTLSERGGLAAFAAALSEGENDFGANFLVWSAGSLPITLVDRLAQDFAKSGARFDCTWFSRESGRLVREGKHHSAMIIWNAFCAGTHHIAINDFRFVDTEDEPGPFDWRYPENAGVDIQLSDLDGQVFLHYSNTQPVYHVIAQRYAALAPARYDLRVDETGAAGAGRWGIACIGRGTAARDLKLEADGTGVKFFVVPVGCTVQELSIAARSSSGDIGRIEIRRAGK